MLFLNQYVTGDFGDGPWLRHVRLCGWIELEISECTSAGGGLGWLILILIFDNKVDLLKNILF